jgi:hypothetical protein
MRERSGTRTDGQYDSLRRQQRAWSGRTFGISKPVGADRAALYVAASLLAMELTVVSLTDRTV